MANNFNYKKWLNEQHYLVRFQNSFVSKYLFISIVLAIKIGLLYFLGLDNLAKNFIEIGLPCGFIGAVVLTMNEKI